LENHLEAAPCSPRQCLLVARRDIIGRLGNWVALRDIADATDAANGLVSVAFGPSATLAVSSWTQKDVASVSELFGFLADKAATAKCSVVHQIDKAHVAFIKRIMTGWCTRRLRLLAELSVHGEPLLEYGTPIAG
jgi:hypothetical protein